MLFDADPSRGEVLCTDVAGGYEPQGGPLPSSLEWGTGCADASRVVGAGNCSGNVWSRAQPVLSTVFRGEVVGVSRPGLELLGSRAPTPKASGTLEFASSLCIEKFHVVSTGARLDRRGLELMKMAPSCESAAEIARLVGGPEEQSCEA